MSSPQAELKCKTADSPPKHGTQASASPVRASDKGLRGLVLVDSLTGKIALAKAIAHAKQALHIVEEPNFMIMPLGPAGYGAPEVGVNLITETMRELREAGAELIKGVKETAAQEQVPIEAEMLEASLGTKSAQMAVDYAAEHGVDILFCGTTEKGALTRLLIGSFCEHVVRNAACNVQVCR